MSRPLKERSLRLRVAVAAGVCLALLFGATGYALRDARDAARARATEALGNISLSVERDFSRSLQGYDILLRATAEGSQGVEEPLNETSRRLLFEAGTAPLFGSIDVTDAAGMVVRASKSADIGLDLSASRYFQEQRGRDGLGLVPGGIEMGRRTNRPKIPLSRRLTDVDGAFQGIAVGNVKLDYFNRAFTVYRLGEDGVVELLSLDGRLLAGAPFTGDRVGRDISGTPIMLRLQTEGIGTFEAVSQYDGRTRLYTARRLADLPFYIVVGMSKSAIFADWDVRAWETAALLVCFLSMVCVLWLALRRELASRAAAEQASAGAAARLTLVADTMDDMILDLDWEGRRRMVSGACERMLGVSTAELLGQNAYDFVHPDDKPRLVAALERMRADGTPCDLTYQIRRRDGLPRIFEVRGRRLPDGSGAIMAVRDATDRVEMEARLRDRQRTEAVGQLSAGVARDFNNLLQAQTTALELLADETRREGGSVKYAAMALSAGKQAIKLTHGLLAFSGRQVLRPEAVDLRGLLSRIRGATERTLDQRMELRLDIEAALAPPLADTAQLEDALLQLCLNARDAMAHSGGPMLIEAYDGGSADDVPEGVNGAACTVLAVSDEGTGMDAGTLAQACEPFFTTKGVGQGAGLGLSVVQGFVRQTGGELRVQSWPGVGTRVEMWLPQAAVADSPAMPRPHSAEAAGPGRLLLVDDDSSVRMLLMTMLTDAGFAVMCAASGEEALGILRCDSQFDVLISDYAMDGMNGGQLIREARRLHRLLPALIITGYADVSALDEVPDGVDIICKPFPSDELVLRVATLMTARQAA